MEALWKRQTAAVRSSQARFSARRAERAADRIRPQQLLAPYKQEVARSSRAPPTYTGQHSDKGSLGKPRPECARRWRRATG
jgi:hypothetical protein